MAMLNNQRVFSISSHPLLDGYPWYKGLYDNRIPPDRWIAVLFPSTWSFRGRPYLQIHPSSYVACVSWYPMWYPIWYPMCHGPTWSNDGLMSIPTKPGNLTKPLDHGIYDIPVCRSSLSFWLGPCSTLIRLDSNLYFQIPNHVQYS